MFSLGSCSCRILLRVASLSLAEFHLRGTLADVLTKYLQASTLHKLLPKLGVMTRAVDSKDLLSVISLEGRVSSQPPTSSFFIGMLAESHASAQLVASRAYSRRSLPRSLRPESRQEAEAPSTPTSFTWSSFRWFYLCSAALLCLPFFFKIFDIKLYGALLSGGMLAVQLFVRTSFILEQAALRTRTAATAFRTLSSVALGSLSPRSLLRILLATFVLAWVALIMQKKSLLLTASFAQSDSFKSLPSLCFSSFCLAASVPASACSMSLASASSATSELAAAPASIAASSFSHQEATMMQLHNEAFSLPEALLDHVLKAKLVTKEGEALPEQLTASQFKNLVPQLDKKQLRFWMILHEEAFQEFKASGFDQLPRQRCEDTRNANLGNWQASSSFAKQAAFYGWIVNRHPKLSSQEAFVMSFDIEPERFTASASFMSLGQTVSLDYRASDTQLVWWGKLEKTSFQPSIKKLGVEVGAFAWQLPSFKSTNLQDKLYMTASFDWGSTSSAWQLSRHWKADSLQHPDVYAKLADSLGEASPLAKLIKKQLQEGTLQQPQPASAPPASAALSSFWKKQAQLMAASLQTTLGNVEALLEEKEAADSLEAAWPAEQLSQEAWEEPAGRFDGSELPLASGFGNLPLDLKMKLAEGLGNFRPQ